MSSYKYNIFRLAVLAIFCLIINIVAGFSQIPVEFIINTNEQNVEISPLIYGTNGDIVNDYTPARRLGGNRLTGYNWTNNFSNAGIDYINNSDDYMPYILGVPDAQAEQTGIVLTTFHNVSLTHQSYTLLQLQVAGYVARDKNGTVSTAETAPSARWAKVINRKGAPFSLSPDITSDKVYMDEELNFLINTFGKAADANGVRAYELDNEPGIWADTHPRLHPNKVKCLELFQKSVDLAGTIKGLDPDADVYGPALYGFNDYFSLQDAPDWPAYKAKYYWFIDAYLDNMKKASDSAGTRLLDVLDLHWYPDINGVYNSDTSIAVSKNRMQATRTLWDSSYTEDSWIGQNFSPVALFYHLWGSIKTYYPGTKLAITEYDYAAPGHISGGIAQADALGLFGKFGLYSAFKFNSSYGLIGSAFRIYLNYDGKKSMFANMSVSANSSDNANSSIYASISTSDTTVLHFIAINKSYDSQLSCSFKIVSNRMYKTGTIWYFGRSDSTIKKIDLPASSIVNNQVTCYLPPLTVSHFVLKTGAEAGAENSLNMSENNPGFEISPNPVKDRFSVQMSGLTSENTVLKIFDIYGNMLKSYKITMTNQQIIIPEDFPAGVYVINLTDKNQNSAKKLILIR